MANPAASASVSATPSKGNHTDRLSALPDELLLSVLCRIPTRSVVQTGVLSRRWRYLWTSVTALDLGDCSRYCNLDYRYGLFCYSEERSAEEKKRKRKFKEFADKVLYFHHPLALQKFSLSCTCVDSLHPVEDWVRIAVTRGVRELELEVVRLPSHLFVSRSLVDLELHLSFSELKLPGAIALPALQRMSLGCVVFTDDDLTSKLFSGCGVLRSLTLGMCHYDRLRCLEISTPVLQDLTIDGSVDDINYDDHNIIDCQVKISAPLLRSFLYHAPLAQDYDFDCLSSLVEVEVCVQNFEFIQDQHHLKVLHGFLDRLSGTRKLKICEACVEALSRIPASVNRAMVLFYQVNSLVMVSWRQDYTVLSLILRFLASSHLHLKTLNYEFLECPMVSTCSDVEEDEEDDLSEVSQSYAGLLEQVFIKTHEFTDELLELVEIVLRTQPRLRRMLLEENPSDNERYRCSGVEPLMQKVLSFPRSSKNLVISFI